MYPGSIHTVLRIKAPSNRGRINVPGVKVISREVRGCNKITVMDDSVVRMDSFGSSWYIRMDTTRGAPEVKLLTRSEVWHVREEVTRQSPRY